MGILRLHIKGVECALVSSPSLSLYCLFCAPTHDILSFFNQNGQNQTAKRRGGGGTRGMRKEVVIEAPTLFPIDILEIFFAK